MSDDYSPGVDSYTETQTTGWFDRLGNAVIGVILGLVLIAGCAWGLFWNEGRAVTTARSLAEGAALVVEADASQIDPANAGRLIHVSGDLTTRTPLYDREFGVGEPAIRLERVVEMFQWKERRSTSSQSNFGGSRTKTTSYDYELVWAPGRIESNRFRHAEGHANPAPRFQRLDALASDVELGAFRPGQAVPRLLPLENLPIPAEAVEALRSRYPDAASAEGGKIFLGADPAAPRLGDVRVSYKILRPGPVSVIGAQSGADFLPYRTQAGDSVLLAERGAVPAERMFAAAERNNVLITWALRAAGAVVMWIGFYMLARPFVVLADVIPLFGDVIAAGAGLFAGVATLIAAPASIAAAWFYYRPAASALILIAGVALAYGARLGANPTKGAPPPAPPRPLQGGAPLGAGARGFGRR